MAECLLSEIHGAEFQAILHLLSSSEHASLRQVSKAVCQRTEQHVPYITLRLCENSSIDQLQQWCQATQQFRHVSCLYIQIFGTVSAERFDSAMLALSLRTSITQLRLSPLKASNNSSISTNHSSSMEPCITSLMPVTRLLPKLRVLVVEDVIISNLSKDLQQLAQAATTAAAADIPWQLRSLVLNTDQAPSADRGTHTDWSDFCCTLKQLTTALADLKHFELRLPTLSYAAEDTKAAAESSNEDTQALPYDEHHYNQDYDDHFNIAAAGAGEDDEDDDDEIIDNPAAADSAQQLQIQQAQVATAAAVANAVLQLGSLQELAISNLPDIWKPPSAAAAVALSEAAAATAARRPTAVEDANAFVKAILGSGVLSSALTAAEAFATMDDCGLWLLQHHLSLRELHLSTAQRGWEMSWQQKQQHSTDFSNSSGSVSKGQHAAAPTSESFADQIEWDVYIVRHSAKRPAAADDDDAAAADADADSSEQSLITTFNHSLSYYSSRLVLVTMRHITGCILKIHHDQIDDLADLMADLRSLKHLQIKIIPSDKDSQDEEEASLCAAKAIKAAAVVPGLQLLGVNVDDAITAAISNNLLLPLTAAAGGPGNSLKRLKLCGKWRVTMEQEADFVASLQQLQDEFGSFTAFPNMSQADRMQRSQSADDVPAAAADSNQFWEQMYKQTQLIIDNASKSAELISPDLKWQQPLKQLDGLTEFVLVDHALLYRRSKYKKFMMHTLSVGMLPACLEVLNCTGLNIVYTDDTAISSGAASSKYAAGGTASWSSSWLKGSATSLIGSDCLIPHSSQAKAECEQLQMLNLTDCQLSSPSILASSQLQQLSILRSNWPGGWAAAAAAWPNVRELVWTYNSTFSRSNLACRSSSNAESSSCASHQVTEQETASPAVLDSSKLDLPGLSVREVLPDILAQFKHLRSLSIHDLPWLSVDILKLVEPQQLRKLQYVDFDLIDSRSSLEMKQQRYLSTQIALASVDLAWARYGRPVPRRNRDGSSGRDPRVVKQWLQRQVPWACVA